MVELSKEILTFLQQINNSKGDDKKDRQLLFKIFSYFDMRKIILFNLVQGKWQVRFAYSNSNGEYQPLESIYSEKKYWYYDNIVNEAKNKNQNFTVSVSKVNEEGQKYRIVDPGIQSVAAVPLSYSIKSITIVYFETSEKIGQKFLEEVSIIFKFLDIFHRVKDFSADYDSFSDMAGELSNKVDVLQKKNDLLLSQSESAIIIFNSKLTSILLISKAFEKIFGRTRQSAYSDVSVFFNSIYLKDRKLLMNALKDYYRAGSLDVKIITPGGEIKECKFEFCEFYDEKNPGSIMVTVSDETAIADLKKQLEFNSRKLSAILSALDEVVMILDAGGFFRELYIPENKYSSLKPELMLHKNFRELGLDDESVQYLKKQFGVVRKKEKKIAFSYEHSSPNSGKKSVYNIRISPIFDLSGNFNGYIVAFSEVTEIQRLKTLESEFDRKLDLKILAMDRDFYYCKKYMESLDLFFFSIDRDGKCNVLNFPKKFKKLVLFEKISLAEKAFDELFVDFPALNSLIERMEKAFGGIRQYQTVLIDETEYLFHFEPLKTDNVKVDAVLVAVDEPVNHRRNLLEDEKIRLVRVYIESLSHEMREPLNTVMGYTQLLEKNISDTLLHDKISGIKSGGRQLLNMLNRLLNIESVFLEDNSLFRSSFSSAEVMDSVSDYCESVAGQKGVSLVFDISDSIPEILVSNKDKLQLALLNIVDSAFSELTTGSSIDIEAGMKIEEEFDYLTFSVRYTGRSISESEIKLISSSSFSLIADKPECSRVCLNLYFARKIISALGGHLEINGSSSLGNNILVQIPVEDSIFR